jgi:hypothetical protein
VAETLLDEEFEADNSGHKEMGENALYAFYRGVRDTLLNNSETGPAESGADADANDTTMSEKTQELVDNHGFKAKNLPDESTECFETIYNRFAGDQSGSDVTENSDAVVFESEDAFRKKVKEIVANRQAQSDKERLASEIAANSAEYDDAEAVLEDYPTEAALNTKRSDVLGGQPDFGGARGAAADVGTNSEDAEDLKIFGSDA